MPRSTFGLRKEVPGETKDAMPTGAQFLATHLTDAQIADAMSVIVDLRKESSAQGGTRQEDHVRLRPFVQKIIARCAELGTKITEEELEAVVQSKLNG